MSPRVTRAATVPRLPVSFALDDWLLTREEYSRLLRLALDVVTRFHQEHPARSGIPRADLLLHLDRPTPLVGAALIRALVNGNQLTNPSEGSNLSLPEFTPTVEPKQRQAADRFLAALTVSPMKPPDPAAFGLERDTCRTLVDADELVRIAPGLYFLPVVFARIVAKTFAMIDATGGISIATFRDHFGTSRKYAQLVLESFDRQGVTRRVGDLHVRGAFAPPREEAP